ncbi:hypothetical protein [Polaromonas eurypsychrophila]|uniref:hypothetical protein n=1 Tax=Polaromonas eurypsychrophila TaxID=1614635 RepID=UPI00166D0AF8|nr:hypothetical protein [Polaromonas eurypsychrophila]
MSESSALLLYLPAKTSKLPPETDYLKAPGINDRQAGCCMEGRATKSADFAENYEIFPFLRERRKPLVRYRTVVFWGWV